MPSSSEHLISFFCSPEVEFASLEITIPAACLCLSRRRGARPHGCGWPLFTHCGDTGMTWGWPGVRTRHGLDGLQPLHPWRDGLRRDGTCPRTQSIKNPLCLAITTPSITPAHRRRAQHTSGDREHAEHPSHRPNSLHPD